MNRCDQHADKLARFFLKGKSYGTGLADAFPEHFYVHFEDRFWARANPVPQPYPMLLRGGNDTNMFPK